jgi:CheY-like chemotaxis protein
MLLWGVSPSIPTSIPNERRLVAQMVYTTVHLPLERADGRERMIRGGDRDTSVNTPIRVLLADDHTMFREGLAAILASHGGLEIVAEAPNDEDALRLARELSPDVVIMQVQMPFQRAVATLEAMRSFPDPPKVVIVTMFESPRYVRDLTGAGALAYLLKTSSSEHLVAAVRAAVLDPEGKNAVVGMPPGDAGGEWRRGRECPLGQGTGDPALGGTGALQPPDSLLSSPLGGDRQAPPGQHLPEDGRLLARGGG